MTCLLIANVEIMISHNSIYPHTRTHTHKIGFDLSLYHWIGRCQGINSEQLYGFPPPWIEMYDSFKVETSLPIESCSVSTSLQ